MAFSAARHSRSRLCWILSILICFVVLIAWIEHGFEWLHESSAGILNGDESGIAHQPNNNAGSLATSGDPFLANRLRRAEYLWKQMVDGRAEMLSAYDHTTTRFPDGYIYPYNVWDFARPAFFCPHDLERVGTLGDGGKWVCGMSRYEEFSKPPSTPDSIAGGAENRPLIVYSFGVNDDSSFEAALLQRTNAEIWGYDFSVDGWAKQITSNQLQRAHFSKAGIARTSNVSASPPFYSIQDIMRKNNHTYVDLVKMDIEGAEYDAISSLIAFVESARRSARVFGSGRQHILPIGQLLIELHFMNVDKTFTVPKDMNAWLNWWRSLERTGMRQVNNEDNWIGNVGTGKPRFMEYTLLNALDVDRNILLR